VKKLIVVGLAGAAGLLVGWWFVLTFGEWCDDGPSGRHCPCWPEGQCDYCQFGDGPHSPYRHPKPPTPEYDHAA
jgi:hypothetical protein